MASPRAARLLSILLPLTAYACISASGQPPANTPPRTHSAILKDERERTDNERAAWDGMIAESLHTLVVAAGGTASPSHGFLVLHLLNEQLFERGRADLSPSGQGVLEQLGPLVGAMQAADVERPTLYTSGPVLVTGYPADWPLSEARAGTVAQFLETLDVDARLSPAGRASGGGMSQPPARRVDLQLPASGHFQGVYFDSTQGR